LNPHPDRPRNRIALLALAILALFVGCRSTPDNAGIAVNFHAEASRVAELKQPMVVLVAEVGRSRADDNAWSLLQSPSVKAAGEQTVTVLLDIAVSRNRATATQFHIRDAPLLVCLSSRGVIISRDEGPITKKPVLHRIDQARQEGPLLDAQLASLENAFARATNDPAAQFALPEFLLAHHNAREAIAPLEAIAHAKTNPTGLRIRAWVALVRAHYWVAEPEKGRHEAENLIATLGAESPEARAGGELVLGIQDANGKRPALARQELETAVAAAPNSPYGRQASEALMNLSKGVPLQ
jgi:hypothetical protein